MDSTAERPHLLTRVPMKPEVEGGRHSPFWEGYCPHLVVPGREGGYLGVRASACPGPVAPGEEAEVAFEWRYPPAVDYSSLAPGCDFLIMEGARVVGTGRVIGPYHAGR